jgi:hypothetical protein
MSGELRDKIAEIVLRDRGFKSSQETADDILAIPEIREALAAKVELDALKLALLQQQTPRPGNVWQPVIPE